MRIQRILMGTTANDVERSLAMLREVKEQVR